MTEQKVSLPDRTNIGKTIPTTYVSRRESLRSEVVRKEIPTYIDSICRPPSKPPDEQNSLEGEIHKKMLPYLNPIYRPPPKPPDTQNTKGKRKWIFRLKPYMKSFCRPPPKPNIKVSDKLNYKKTRNKPTCGASVLNIYLRCQE